jgi:hypothetical protein
MLISIHSRVVSASVSDIALLATDTAVSGRRGDFGFQRRHALLAHKCERDARRIDETITTNHQVWIVYSTINS